MRALIADDDPVTRAILIKALKPWDLELTVAADGTEAWEALSSGQPPEIAIVDWMMPGMDGIELCRRVREYPALAGIYVILLTGRGSRTDLVAGLDAGADDYMVKPIDTEELRARVQVGIRVANLQGRLADRVTELQGARDHLARLVSTDALTNLYSRRWWFELAATEFSRCRRYDRAFSVMVIDLDYFKQVNDTFGHDAGDKLLRAFADMLQIECRQSDILGRLGGEEFAILVPETPVGAAQPIASRIREACRNVKVTAPAGDDVTCSCSIGISQVQSDDDDIDDVLRRADAALYEAKRSGRDCWKSHEYVGAA
jgi:two-component system, cell cycle response regulator